MVRPKPPTVGARDSDEDTTALEASLARHGQLQPILVRPDGEVVIGHKRAMAAAKSGVTPNIVVVDVDPFQALLMRASDEFAKSDLPLEIRRALVKAVAQAMRTQGEVVTHTTLADRVGTTVEEVRRYLSIDELPAAVQELTETPIPAANAGKGKPRATTKGGKAPDALPNSSGKPRVRRYNDDRVLSAKAAEKLAIAKRSKLVTDIELESLGTKMGKGVLAASTRAIDEIISFLKEASPEGRRALIHHGTATLEKAQEVDKKAKKKEEQAKRDQESSGNSASAVFSQVVETLKRWGVYVRGIRKAVAFVPENRRAPIIKYLMQLRDGIDDCLVELEAGLAPKAGQTPPPDVIDLVEGEYRIVSVRGEVAS